MQRQLVHATFYALLHDLNLLDNFRLNRLNNYSFYIFILKMNCFYLVKQGIFQILCHKNTSHVGRAQAQSAA